MSAAPPSIDELNALLDRAEDEFLRENFAVPASIVLEDRVLEFRRYDGNWGFFVRRPSLEPVPLLKASKKVRVEAAMKLEALWEACVAAREEADLDILGAVEAVRSFLGSHSPEEPVPE